MEIHLDRALQEKRLYPAIHPLFSATRPRGFCSITGGMGAGAVVAQNHGRAAPIEAMEKLIENWKRPKQRRIIIEWLEMSERSENSKFQMPSSKEAQISKLQNRLWRGVPFGA